MLDHDGWEMDVGGAYAEICFYGFILDEMGLRLLGFTN